MEVFERPIHTDESLTLGSNTEDHSLKSGNMYVVFVKGNGRTQEPRRAENAQTTAAAGL
jgi:hypothetical protein